MSSWAIRETSSRPLRKLTVPLAVAVAFLAGCEHRTNLVEPGSESDTTPGTVQRATLELAVAATPQDTALTRVIGFEEGFIPEAEVTIRREGTAGSEQTLSTDSSGVAVFEELLPGEYRITVFRLLTVEEIQALVEEGENVTAFTGAERMEVSAPVTEATVAVEANRESSSLVISEISITDPRLPSGNFYRFGQYLEVYNNTDTTIFLDGKVLVKGFFFGLRDANETFNCETMEPWREDPDGIWTQRLVEAFPGSGADFPLPPGEAVVIATDAIDHRTVDPGLPDLTSADFEFIGSEDADNPDVPNMVRLGREMILGHGIYWGLTKEVAVVAEPVNVAELPKEDVPGVLDPEHWRIPRSKILDVAVLALTPPLERELNAALGEFCERFTHENFDRGRAPLIDVSTLNGHHRKVIATLNGRKVLQRTKVSELDFFSGPMSPGFISDE